MDKTVTSDQIQQNHQVSPEKLEEIRVSKQMAEVLKRDWVELQKKQQQKGMKIESGRRVSSVSLVQDKEGRVAVNVNMENGKKIRDNNQEKIVTSFKERAEKVYTRFKIEEILNKIREYGWAAVEGEIPADLRNIVIKACERANISLTSKGEKAEEAAVIQAAIRSDINDKDNNNNVVIDDKNKDDLNDILNVGNVLMSPVQEGTRPFSIPITPNIQKLLDKGVKVKLPPLSLNMPKEHDNLCRSMAQRAVEITAKSSVAKEAQAISVRRPESLSVVVVLDNDRSIKGDANSISYHAVQQEAFLRLLSKDPEQYTAQEQEMYGKVVNTLQDMDFVPKDITKLSPEQLSKAVDVIKHDEQGILSRIPKWKQSNIYPDLLNSLIDSKKQIKEGQQSEEQKSFSIQKAKIREENKNRVVPLKVEEGWTFEQLKNESRHRKDVGLQRKEDRLMSGLYFMYAHLNNLDQNQPIPPEAKKWVEQNMDRAAEVLSCRGKVKSNQELQQMLDQQKQAGVASFDQAKQSHHTLQNPQREQQQVSFTSPSSIEKIKQAKAVLDKEAQGVALTEKEQKLLNFVHQTFRKVPDLKKEDLEAPANQKQLTEMLKCKKLYSNLPKDENQGVQKSVEKTASVPSRSQTNGNQSQKTYFSSQYYSSEKERVAGKIRENMTQLSSYGRPPRVNAQEKVGLQEKIQQYASKEQKTTRQTQIQSPIIQAAIMRKERE